jgi:ELWxxDGT repeat protein
MKNFTTSSPADLTGVNDRLFFTIIHTAPGEELRQELWTSDGTEAGTVQVRDSNGSADQWVMLENLTNVNGTLFFSVLSNDGHESTHELWRSDGTTAGTLRVKEGDPDFNRSDPRSFTNVNGTLFFAIDTPERFHTTQLWKSDGSPAGTVPIQAFPPAPPSATPQAPS